MSSSPVCAAPRSLLFVPADSERKMARASASSADLLILDLEDSVLAPRKALARDGLARFITDFRGDAAIWVRINDLESGVALEDVVAAVSSGAAGVVLPKWRSPDDLMRLQHYLEMAEHTHGRESGSVGIIMVCTETPEAVLRLPQLLERSWPRLRGMLWGAEDLSSALGAGDPREASGAWRPLYQHVRNQCLLVCSALGIAAFDTVFVDIADKTGCQNSALQARHDGFVGKVAIHPVQIDPIHSAFAPSEDELNQARRVVAAFEAGQGAVSLDGRMLDVPHLKAARRLLAAASR